MSEKIIDYIPLDGRHTRSIALDRDLLDAKALEQYVVTPNSLGALRQISTGLLTGQAQRAWKIVGPYGSGKSAFGILLAQLSAGKANFPAAAKALNAVSPKIAKAFVDSNRFPIAVVGSRVSFGTAFASSVNDALTSLGKSKSAQKLRKKLNFQAGTYSDRPLNAAIGEMAGDLAEAAKALGLDGVILLIDEVGKFVEHAALYPEHGDLIALQQIAEYACKSDDDSVAVVAMLHQHFASYAAGVGRALGDEWHKVAARFEEIPFDEPVERYAHFAKQAFAEGDLTRNKQIVTAARKEYSRAVKQSVLRAPTAADKELFDRAESLYPLHPLVLGAAATISKRYGQSERSFHAFLYGGESFAMRDFAQRSDASADSWYRVQDLYDYLAHGNELRFRELDAERKWSFANAVIEQQSANELAGKLLKAIAVFELVKANLGLRADVETLGWVIGESDSVAVVAALTQLTEAGILVKRHKQAEYAFAVSSAINVEALYEKAARSDESELMVKGTMAALAQKLVVANRHYDETGTIRTVSTVVGTLGQWPVVPSAKDDAVQADAWIKLVLLNGEAEQIMQCEKKFAEEPASLTLHAYLSLSAEGRAALSEYAIWTSIAREINVKSLDPWTSRYVDSRVTKASEDVERLVLSALTPIEGRTGPIYWHCANPIENSAGMNQSQVASWLFDHVYSKAPQIINELINKDRPTSAIVLARQRLFEVLLGGDTTRQICADHEYPPERLIHSTLLKQTGIWSETGTGWVLSNPAVVKGNQNISVVWAEISRVLQKPAQLTFADLLEALSAPPFGVRNGPAGIWAALYLIVNRNRCAMFERGSLVLELTVEHIMRMYKNPQAFTVRELASEDASKRLVSDCQEVLSAIGCQTSADPSFLEMTRVLYRWFVRLPDFTKATARIGKDAAIVKTIISKSTDPIALLTQTLPKAHTDSKSKSTFKEWLTAALTDLGMAHRRLQDEVANELSKGFGIPGTLNRIRTQLQNECTREAATLADADLRSFILRCTDVVLTDEKWLDSVGSLIAHRPLDAWQDDTLAKFQDQLTELCGRYRRWMQLVMKRGVAPRASERFVGLTLTMPGGEESSVFVARNEVSDSIAESVLALVEKSANGDRNAAAAALVHALLQLQIEAAIPEKEVSNG
ncbi:hypothetical protein [Pseudomonas sp.]|uniref:hypothetical protein n=1 Tax=Pseudomonas sp. TaxID=306 RepID=UPI002626CA42|nr:hypothetical protein [Pseudomonas sp.]